MPQGKGVRCWGFYSSDGKYAHCTREEYAGQLEPTDANTYAHRLSGRCRCGETHDAEVAPRVAPDVLRERLGALLIEAAGTFRDEPGKTAAFLLEQLQNVTSGKGLNPHGEAVLEALQRLRVNDEARRLFAAERRGETPVPEAMTLAEQLLLPDEAEQHRIEGWQQEGHRVLLSATRKSGKTTLRDNLIRALADGVPFLDAFTTYQPSGTIGVLDFELNARQGRQWLRRQRMDHPERVVPFWLRGMAGAFDIRDDAVRAEWAGRLREAGVTYLIIDCLTPILAALDLSENTEARVFLYALDALLAEAEVPEALVIHHMGHGAERARGDSALEGWADVPWHLTMLNPTDMRSTRHLSAFGRDVETAEGALAFNELTGRLRWVGGTRRETSEQAALDAVVAVVRRNPGISPNKVEAERPAEFARDRWRRAIEAVQEQGLVRPEKNTGGRGDLLYPLADTESPRPADSPPADTADDSPPPL